MKTDREAWIKMLCEGSLYFFLIYIFKKVYKRDFIESNHIKKLCQIMQGIYNGEKNRVIINIPPRYSKTLVTVIGFCTWSFLKNRNCNFLHVSYSDRLVEKNSKEIIQILSDKEIKKLWNIEINKNESSKKNWSIKDGGGMYSVSTGGAVTGFGAGIKGEKGFSGALIIDDPIKANAERFDNARETAISNFENVLSSRLNNKDTPIVLIQQRLHEEDLAGYLISGKSSSGDYELIRMPAVMDGPKSYYDKRDEGDVLWPHQHSIERLKEIKRKNPVLFSGQYQQDPAPVGGLMIQEDWLEFYRTLPPKENMRIFLSCDPSFSDEGQSNAAISVYGIGSDVPGHPGTRVFLLDQICEQLTFVKTLDGIKKLLSRWGYEGILIEDKANGPALISSLNKAGITGVIPWPPKGSKVDRFSRVTPLYRGGDIVYPHPDIAPWVVEHIDELKRFPKGKNDDRVDAESQFLGYFQSEWGTLEFYDI